MSKKQNFNFTLVLSGVDDKTEALEDILFEAGCDDALINFRNRTVYLDFDRAAFNFEDAVISAIKQVESVRLPITVIHVAPDEFVTETEIAERLQVKRQAVSLWFKGERHAKNPFPVPMMKLTQKSPMWRWHDVVEWLYNQKKIADLEIVEHAKFIGTINAALFDRDSSTKRYKEKLLKQLKH